MLTLRKIISSLLVFPFLMLPLFCCCIKQAHATPVQVNNCHDAHNERHASHNQADHKSSSTCDCYSLSASAENVAVMNASFLSGSAFPSFLGSDIFKSVNYQKSSIILLSYLGPPQSALSSVPFYIMYRSLRI